MSRSFVLYRLSRPGFNRYARAYYRDPRSGLAVAEATEVLDLGSDPFTSPWPLSVHRLPGVPPAWVEKMRAAYRMAWDDHPSSGRPWPFSVERALSGGRLLAHLSEGVGTGASFYTPQQVAAESARQAGGPSSGAVRLALEALHEEIASERRRAESIWARVEGFEQDAKAMRDALGRLDFRTGLARASRVASRIANATNESVPPRFKRDELIRADTCVAHALVSVDEWERSGTEGRLDRLRSFYSRATDAWEYVVMEGDRHVG